MLRSVCGFDHQTINLQLLDIALLGNPSQKFFRCSASCLSAAELPGAPFASTIRQITDRKLQRVSLKRDGHDSVRIKPSSSPHRLCAARGSPRVRGHFIHRPETPRHNCRPGTEKRARISACHCHRTAPDFRERAPTPNYSGAPTTTPRGQCRCMRKDPRRTPGAALRRFRLSRCQG